MARFYPDLSVLTGFVRRLRLPVVLMVALALVLPGGPALAANTLVVTTIAPTGPGSLRGQIAAASAGDTIDFDHTMAGQTIALQSSGELLVEKSLTIQNTSGGPVTVDGSGQSRVFHVTAGAVTLRGLTIQNGRATDGAGLRIESGASATVAESVIQQNTAHGAPGEIVPDGPTTGGAPGWGGAIYNAGTLTVTASTISENAAAGGDGGIAIASSGANLGGGGGAGLGGGLFNTGAATIVNSTFTMNRANGGQGGGLGGLVPIGTGGGGAGLGGGIFQFGGSLLLTNVTLAGGTATGGHPDGTVPSPNVGTPAAFGFGADATTASVGLSGGFGGGGGSADGNAGGSGNGGGGNGGATVAPNVVGSAGSGQGGGLFVYGGAAEVAASTIVKNAVTGGSLTWGGGISSVVIAPGLRTSILAGNTAPTDPELHGGLASRGYNLLQAGPQISPGNIAGQDPLLAPLALNRPGGVMTYALLKGSPAIDFVPPSACQDAKGQPLLTDQRGVARPVDGNHDGSANCDIGAFEVSAAQLTPGASTLSFTEGDVPRPIDAGLEVGDAGSPTLSGATVTITTGFVTGEDQLGFAQLGAIAASVSSDRRTLTLSGTASLAEYQAALRSVTYQSTAHPPTTAPRTIAISVQADTVGSVVVSHQVTVVNLVPTAAADTFSTRINTALTVAAPGVLANDTDASGSHLAASATTNPQHGTLTLNPTGGFTYTPASGFVGTDTFGYRASDGQAQSAPATVTVAVAATACVPRPKVQVTPAAGGGKLNVHVEATPLNTAATNPIARIDFGVLQNAKVTLNGQTFASGQSYTPATAVSALDFTVERAAAGQATTVPYTVVDGCGSWPSFVGGGTGAGF